MTADTKLLAVLIDADNTSPKYAKAIFEEISGFGEASVRRCYGDFSSSRISGWSERIASFGLDPHHQPANTVAKNASDIALVIDAMDLRHTGWVRSQEQAKAKAKGALTELFVEVKSGKTPVVVERIVADVDEIVRLVRFPGWQDTKVGEREVQKALRKVIYVKYKIKHQDLLYKAFGYIRQYY